MTLNGSPPITANGSDRLCQQLVADITDVAVKNGLQKLILHGNHEHDGIKNVDILMSVEDLSLFYDRAFCEIAGTAFRHGLYGSVNAVEASEFPNGFASMQEWYGSTAKIRKVERQGSELVFVE